MPTLLPRLRLRSHQSKIIAWAFIPAALILGTVALVAFFANRQITADLVMERDRQLVQVAAMPAGTAVDLITTDVGGTTLDVSVITAFPLSDAIEDKLAASLKERLQRDVVLHSEIDKDLIGGAVIRAGDLVIDGSVRGKLARLAESMKG